MERTNTQCDFTQALYEKEADVSRTLNYIQDESLKQAIMNAIRRYHGVLISRRHRLQKQLKSESMTFEEAERLAERAEEEYDRALELYQRGDEQVERARTQWHQALLTASRLKFNE